jgi:hypothetical protein
LRRRIKEEKKYKRRRKRPKEGNEKGEKNRNNYVSNILINTLKNKKKENTEIN